MIGSNSAPAAQPTMAVDRVTVKAPPFWKKEPNLWFIQLEVQFTLSQITTYSTKYNHVLSALDSEILQEVAEFLYKPPESDKYLGLKDKLICVFSESQEQKTRKLLSGIELGDRKPSQLLSHLRRLGGTVVPDELLKTLWMQRLPVHLQSVLATSLDPLAKMADKIAEIQQPRTYAVAENKESKSLQESVLQLSKDVAELKLSQNSRRHQSQTHSRSRSISRFRGGKSEPAFCWYHEVFKDKAKKWRSKKREY